MSNGNRTRKTKCDICLCLRKFLCSEVIILKSGNTIPKSIYYCILFAIVGVGNAVVLFAIVGVGNAVVSLKSRLSWM